MFPGRQCQPQEEEDPLPKARPIVKQEQMDYEEEQGASQAVSKSILAKALLKPNVANTQEEEETNGDDNKEKEEVEMFYCSSCAMSFTSVNDHLDEFHEGQTVFIEDETQQSNEQDESGFYVVQSKKGDTYEDSESDGNSEGPTEYNTIKEEECVDKDGRLYTRKVVQIEKFWEDHEQKIPPVKLQYILENGKARKIASEQQEVHLEEGQKLLIIFQCSNCSVHFSKEDQYYSHICGSKGNSTMYRCNKCEATFSTLAKLSAHHKLHKTDKIGEQSHSGPHLCEICNTEFPSYKSLRLHRRMHDPIKSKDVEPPVHYGIMGEEQSMDGKDETREMFLCEVCNNTYDKQYEEVHMKSHMAEEDYDCNICNRKFYTQTNLEMHMRVHANGKKFSCSHCKKNFLAYEALQEHIEQQCQNHVKSYACQYCGRRFFRPHEKVKHERIHTGKSSILLVVTITIILCSLMRDINHG